VLVCAKCALAKLEQLVARRRRLLELQVAGVLLHLLSSRLIARASAFSSITA
jgi:hypothetical protein